MNVLAIIIVLVILVIAGYGFCQQKPCPQACPTGQACQQKPCPQACPTGQTCQQKPPAPGAPSVYLVDIGAYGVTRKGAPGLATSLGGTVATLAQLAGAQKAGASWCHYGWTDNTPAGQTTKTYGAYFPAQTTVRGCGGPGVNGPSPVTAAGVTVYGPRPAAGTFPSCLSNPTMGPCIMG